MYNHELALSVLNNQPADPQRVIDEVLRPCADLYHNGDVEESQLTDQQYDYICRIVKQQLPAHSFFTGVGAEVRGGKIALPFQMGSLDQVEIGEFADWVKRLGLKPTDELVIMAKLDGSSAAAILDRQSKLRIAYSRGNGVEGADITRHLKHTIRNIKDVGLERDSTAIRGENIIAVDKFKTQIQPNFKRSGGQPYANARNAVSGMMNASVTNAGAYPFIDFVAYQRLDRNDIDKEDQLLELEDMGFLIPWYEVRAVKDVNEALLAKIINDLRASYEYEIDGVVVEVNSAELRAKLNPTDLNPGYAMKYKTLSNDNYVETEVVEVEWNPSKTSYAKPRVIVKSCVLPGIVCNYVTGYNAKYIVDNGIGPGAIVGISRMGDVVPNIVSVVKQSKAQMPSFDYEWNATKVDIICTDPSMASTVLVAQLTDAARSLDIDGLREGISQVIVDAIATDDFNEVFATIAAWPRKWWTDLIGANGGKIYDDFHLKLSNVSLDVWLGSMPHFGRGVGKRKMKALFEGTGIRTIEEFNQLTVNQIVQCEGFSDKTAAKVVAGRTSHKELLDRISSIVSFKQQEQSSTTSVLAGEHIVMTGFRDGAMEAFIEDNGGNVQSAVSAKTTILVAMSITGSSGKLKKAHDINASGKGRITLMTADDFRKKYMEKQSNTGLVF